LEHSQPPTLDNNQPAPSGQNPTPEMQHDLPDDPTIPEGNWLLRIYLSQESSADNLLPAGLTIKHRSSEDELRQMRAIIESLISAIAPSSRVPLAAIIVKLEQTRVELLHIQFRVEAYTDEPRQATLLEILSPLQIAICKSIRGFRRLQPAKADKKTPSNALFLPMQLCNRKFNQ